MNITNRLYCTHIIHTVKHLKTKNTFWTVSKLLAPFRIPVVVKHLARISVYALQRGNTDELPVSQLSTKTGGQRCLTSIVEALMKRAEFISSSKRKHSDSFYPNANTTKHRINQTGRGGGGLCILSTCST